MCREAIRSFGDEPRHGGGGEPDGARPAAAGARPEGQDAVEITMTTRPGVMGQATYAASTPTSEVLTQMTIVLPP
jgi:hypothetical protein